MGRKLREVKFHLILELNLAAKHTNKPTYSTDAVVDYIDEEKERIQIAMQ